MLLSSTTSKREFTGLGRSAWPACSMNARSPAFTRAILVLQTTHIARPDDPLVPYWAPLGRSTGWQTLLSLRTATRRRQRLPCEVRERRS